MKKCLVVIIILFLSSIQIGCGQTRSAPTYTLKVTTPSITASEYYVNLYDKLKDPISAKKTVAHEVRFQVSSGLYYVYAFIITTEANVYYHLSWSYITAEVYSDTLLELNQNNASSWYIH